MKSEYYLSSQHIILDFASRVQLHSESIGVALLSSAHVERILSNMNLGEGSTITKVLHSPGNPASSLSVRWGSS